MLNVTSLIYHRLIFEIGLTLFQSTKKRYTLNNHLCKLVFVTLVLSPLGIDAQPISDSQDKTIYDEEKSPNAQWLGRWQATGSLFEIDLKSSGGIFSIEKINSMGFDWVSNGVTLEGETLNVAIEYGGAKGVIIANMTNTIQQFANASVAACEPAYMVICALSKNIEIRFQRIK